MNDFDLGMFNIQLINDAIYGPVELTPLMFKIINTSEFHRLKDIKQLGIMIIVLCTQLQIQ